MHSSHLLFTLLTLSSSTHAAILASPPRLSPPAFHISTSSSSSSSNSSKPTNRPLLIWHGLGDSFDSDGISSVGTLYTHLYPSSAVISISQAGTDGSADRQASFLGNLTTQIDATCTELLSRPAIANATGSGINALGFSQGGQFLRGLVERCGGLPRVHSLVTFGSQHNGIFEFAECEGGDWWCRAWSGALRSNTWAAFVQARVVPAQYFRDPAQLDSYLEHSNFLADANNERDLKNEAYKENIARMGKFVMIMFEDDDVVKPKESAWFDEVNKTSGEVTRLEDRALYKEDWLGLKTLGDRGGLIKATTEGGHMQIGDGVLESVMKGYFAPGETKEEAGGRTWRSWLGGGWREQSVMGASRSWLSGDW